MPNGAGWHSSKDLVIPDDITLMTLPSYSPELNPVENPGSGPGQAIWQFLRQNRLANWVFENYGAIVNACCEAWRKLIAVPEQIASRSTRAWAQVND